MAKRRHSIDRLEVDGSDGELSVDVTSIDNDLDTLFRNAETGIINPRRVPHIWVRNVALFTGEQNQVVHGMQVEPYRYNVYLRGDARWWSDELPDTIAIYLWVSADVEADILIEG